MNGFHNIISHYKINVQKNKKMKMEKCKNKLKEMMENTIEELLRAISHFPNLSLRQILLSQRWTPYLHTFSRGREFLGFIFFRRTIILEDFLNGRVGYRPRGAKFPTMVKQGSLLFLLYTQIGWGRVWFHVLNNSPSQFWCRRMIEDWVNSNCRRLVKISDFWVLMWMYYVWRCGRIKIIFCKTVKKNPCKNS